MISCDSGSSTSVAAGEGGHVGCGRKDSISGATKALMGLGLV